MKIKRVKQTILGQNGNCFSACISMITGIPIDSIPVFMEDDGNGLWFKQCKKWLNDKGWIVLYFLSEVNQLNLKLYRNSNSYPIILSGHTERSSEILHAVVAYKDEIYDPHPSDVGIIDVVDIIILIKNEEVKTNMGPVPKDDLKPEVKELRKKIDKNISDAKFLAARIGRDAGGREISLVITKLQEAKMWAGKILEEMGSELPAEYADKA